MPPPQPATAFRLFMFKNGDPLVDLGDVARIGMANPGIVIRTSRL